MPIKTQSDLPAKEILEKENIFVMDENRATHQDIRAINIAILNLMPLKEDTELQLLRSLSNTWVALGDDPDLSGGEGIAIEQHPIALGLGAGFSAQRDAAKLLLHL